MWLFHFLFWTTVTVSAKEQLYGKIGDKAVITPDSVVNRITSIQWKHGLDIAMDWYGDEIFSYRHFKDRGMLNTLTGALTITGLTRDDSGSYTVEINDNIATKTELLVISPVPKPTVSVRCEPEMTYCVLTCSGSTTGAEPVTYRWTSDEITLSSTKEHKITKENKEPWFSCAFENPVSLNSSKKVFNPFINKEPLYMEIGDEVVLTPDSVANRITSIVWTHGPDIAMDWYGGEISAYRHFKDRGTLNTLTGALTITGLTRDDSGNYTAEINDKIASKTELLVISPVPKPTVSDWCTMTYCVLTCSGSTTGAEPVTYWWTSGDITWPSTKEQKITVVELELWFSWFSCALQNPVSDNSSEQVFNPFIRNLLIFIAVFILVVFIIIIIYFRSKGIISFSWKGFYFSSKWRKWVLNWALTFIVVFIIIPVLLIIIFIYIIYKGTKDYTWLFNFIPVWMLVGCIIIIIIYLIYKGIIYFRRKERQERRRKERQERRRKEILERWRKAEREEQEMTEMLQPDQKTSTQDPTSVVTKDPSNGTEKSADCSRTCRLLTDEQTADPEDEAQS